MNLRDLYEARLDERVHDIVYHATYLPHALEIVKTGQFKLSSALAREYGNFEHPKGHPYYLSTSRTKAGNYVVSGGTGLKPVYGSGRVMLKLDGSWFNRHYRSAPVDYYQRTPKGESEQEDRVFSKEPTMPAPNILEIHVFVQYPYPRDGERLRKLMIECKKKSIPIYVYNDGQHWLYQNKKHALSFEEIKTYIEGRVDIDPQRWRATNYFAPWMELWYKNKTEQLSDKAKKLKYDVMYTNWFKELVQQLVNDLNNARSSGTSGYKHAVKLVNLISKLGMKPKDFVQALRLKWLTIGLADKYRIPVDDVKAAIELGTQKELKNSKNNAELAQAYALNNLSYAIDYYNTSENLTESKNSSLVLRDFLKFAVEQLKLRQLPKIKFQKKHSESHPTTFGYFDPDTDHIVIVLDRRHPMDIMRTLAHELVHYKQRLEHSLDTQSGETGSEHENQANATAGILMRDFGKQHPEYFATDDDQLVNEIRIIPPIHREQRYDISAQEYETLAKTATQLPLPNSNGIELLVQFNKQKKKIRVRAFRKTDDTVHDVGIIKIDDRAHYWQVDQSDIDSRYANQNLAAKIYVELAKTYHKIIASDVIQTPAARAVWQKSLPNIGVKPKLFSPETGFESGYTDTAYETSMLLAIDPDELDSLSEQRVDEIQLIPDYSGDLEHSYRADFYKELLEKHITDQFDVDGITVYQTKQSDEAKTFRLIGKQNDSNDNIVLVVVFSESKIRGVSALVSVSTWVSTLVRGKNLAAKVYVAASKRYNRMIVSDDMQTSSGAKIWTRGLPKLGIRPVAYEMGVGLAPGVDPYNKPSDDVRWIFDANRKITSKTFTRGRFTSNDDDNEDED